MQLLPAGGTENSFGKQIGPMSRLNVTASGVAPAAVSVTGKANQPARPDISTIIRFTIAQGAAALFEFRHHARQAPLKVQVLIDPFVLGN